MTVNYDIFDWGTVWSKQGVYLVLCPSHKPIMMDRIPRSGGVLVSQSCMASRLVVLAHGHNFNILKPKVSVCILMVMCPQTFCEG
jgi:hypothetical protein